IYAILDCRCDAELICGAACFALNDAGEGRNCCHDRPFVPGCNSFSLREISACNSLCSILYWSIVLCRAARSVFKDETVQTYDLTAPATAETPAMSHAAGSSDIYN